MEESLKAGTQVLFKSLRHARAHTHTHTHTHANARTHAHAHRHKRTHTRQEKDHLHHPDLKSIPYHCNFRGCFLGGDRRRRRRRRRPDATGSTGSLRSRCYPQVSALSIASCQLELRPSLRRQLLSSPPVIDVDRDRIWAEGLAASFPCFFSRWPLPQVPAGRLTEGEA